MLAQALTFLENMFNKVIIGFAFHCIGDHDEAARQVYRALKLGSIAIATVWISMPHVEALQHAH
ncbi:hypothetical protein HD806DRAFT_485742 [Xylariaceae sp. AK1471]|nr:hypothetical protein HD806DRAFT_485742 [Xylariaceae sp. AK1471]